MPLTQAAIFLARAALSEVAEDLVGELASRETIPLNSTCLAAMTYDIETEDLDLEFVSGHSFSYAGVPHAVALGLLTAPSHGEYYNSEIKGKY